MAVRERKRRDPRREATRVALIEAAESMIADSGVEGVSTRQIGAAVGSSNNNVVAYHFGSREALIEAVYHHRLPQIDARRQELLTEAQGPEGSFRLELLMRALWLPLFEQTGEGGRHSYAGFLAGISRSGMGDTRHLVNADYPATNRVVRHIVELLPPEVASHFEIRLGVVAAMMFAILREIDGKVLGKGEGAKRLFDDAIAMAAAALMAPPCTDSCNESFQTGASS